MEIKEIIEYWVRNAEEDRISAEVMFNSGRFTHALFLCHLMIEKILKAYVVKTTDKPAPYEHNLANLAEKAKMNLLKEQSDLLDEINAFNIRARYDDYKFEFHKKATKEYAEKYFKASEQLYLWLKEELTK